MLHRTKTWGDVGIAPYKLTDKGENVGADAHIRPIDTYKFKNQPSILGRFARDFAISSSVGI